MSEPVRIGAHTITTSENVTLCSYCGPVSLSEVEQIHILMQEALARDPLLYQLIDMSNLPIPSPAVRRWISQWAQHHRLTAVVCFGASTSLRLFLNLLGRAIHLVRGDAPPVIFVRDETEARSWIALHRKH